MDLVFAHCSLVITDKILVQANLTFQRLHWFCKEIYCSVLAIMYLIQQLGQLKDNFQPPVEVVNSQLLQAVSKNQNLLILLAICDGGDLFWMV